MIRETLKDNYNNLLESFRKQSDKQKGKLLILSFSKLIVFISGASLTILGFSYSLLFCLTTFLIFMTVFLWLVKLYSDHSQLFDFYNNLAGINRVFRFCHKPNKSDHLSTIPGIAFTAIIFHNPVNHSF